jgi:Uma2 family endonuclease
MTTTSERAQTLALANDVPGPRQGEWTYNDYAALPDDGRRYEIVDGVLLMTPAPNRWHQKAVLRFSSYLFTYVESAGLGEVHVAPFDVQLAPNKVFQPDVMVVLNTGLEKIKDDRIIGAPDLVVEVAWPATAPYDRLTKYEAYARAGVQEYWIADPVARSSEIFVLEADTYKSLGTFYGKATLPSRVVPGLAVHVQQFFA